MVRAARSKCRMKEGELRNRHLEKQEVHFPWKARSQGISHGTLSKDIEVTDCMSIENLSTRVTANKW